MRIAIYVSSLKGGGAERVMLHLAQGFYHQGHNVDLLLSRHEGSYIEQVPDYLNIIPLKKTSRFRGLFLMLLHSSLKIKFISHFKLPRFFSRLSGVINYINESKPDAIISALHNSNLSAVLAKNCTNSDVKIIVTEHIALSNYLESVPKRKSKLLPLIKILYPLADHQVTVSDGVKNDLAQVADLQTSSISTIFNPVITDEMLKKMLLAVDHSWLISGNHYKLLAAGRLSKQKDFVTLINAIDIIRDDISIKLIILGEGKERENLQKIITDKNLDDIIDLHGFVANPYAYMAHSDLFVMSSILEGLPTVLLEALACGCQIVSTDCPYGPSEILQNGKYGKLIPVKDSKQLAIAIKESYINKDTTNNRQQYALQFNLEKATNQYINLILKK